MVPFRSPYTATSPGSGQKLGALNAAQKAAQKNLNDAEEAIIAAPADGPLAIAVKLAIFLLFDPMSGESDGAKRAVLSIFEGVSRTAGVDLIAEAAPYGFSRAEEALA